MSANASMWLIAPAALVVVRLLAVEANLARVQASNTALVFRCAIGLRLLIAAGMVLFGVQLVKSFGKEEGWVLVMGATIFVLLALGWPSTITVGPLGVSKHRWWRATITIPWKSVTAIEKNAAGDMEVFGSEGQRLAFTRYHIDPGRFEIEIQRRANLERTIDAAAPPHLQL